MRDWRRAFLITALLLAMATFAGCLNGPTISREEARSDIRSAISFTAEAELFVEFVRNDHATRHYAEGHTTYLEDAVKRSINELQREAPEPHAQHAVSECIVQLQRLHRELSGLHTAFGNDAALAAAKDRMSEIREALERAQSSL